MKKTKVSPVSALKEKLNKQTKSRPTLRQLKNKTAKPRIKN